MTVLCSSTAITGLSKINASKPQVDTSTITAKSLAAKTSGKVALTETELRSVVKTLGQTVYWAGPMQGAKYALDRTDNGQLFVRYLPGGKGIADLAPKYRTVATYQESGAFEAMKAAGKQADGITFTNTDGAQVYYDKAVTTNVYLAYENLQFQIEIFDPNPGTAFHLASAPGRIKAI